MRNKIIQKSATKTPQSLPKGCSGLPKWETSTSFVLPFSDPRSLQDPSWTLLGAFSAPEATFGASWPPPGQPRSPSRAIFLAPGTSRRPPKDPQRVIFQSSSQHWKSALHISQDAATCEKTPFNILKFKINLVIYYELAGGGSALQLQFGKLILEEICLKPLPLEHLLKVLGITLGS